MAASKYGVEAIIDVSGCSTEKFTRAGIGEFILELCARIDMTPALETFFWDEENGGATDEPHLKGTSAFRFIETSNIVVHTLEIYRAIFLNIFSCKSFDPELVRAYVIEYFDARDVSITMVERSFHEDL